MTEINVESNESISDDELSLKTGLTLTSYSHSGS